MGNKWFDIKSFSEKEQKKESVAFLKYENIVTEKASSFRDIVKYDLEEGAQVRIVTNNSFNAISVLKYVLENNTIDELYIAVYRMNLKSVQFLKNIIDQFEISTTILLSSFFRENKRYERWCNELIAYGEGNENCKVAFAHNHAKVFLAHTTSGRFIVFEGSGNLSDNARIEQYIYENNKTTYNFHKEWINSISASWK